MEKTRWEVEYEMIENEGLFEEYLEMGTGCFDTFWGIGEQQVYLPPKSRLNTRAML